jgi:hypothetical protein
MRTRIAFGAGFALAAAFVFVFLQFRAEAIAQQAEVTDQEIGAIAQPFAQQATSDEPQPISADSTDPFGTTSSSAASGEELPDPASYDPFASSAELSEPSQPVAEDDDESRNDSKRRKAAKRDLSLFGDEASSADSVGDIGVGADEVFGFDAGGDGFESGSFDAEQTKQPLRVIRFRNVRANDIRSVIRSIFQAEANKQRWFLATEDQSNSLICKVPADKFEQIKRVSEGLDRLASKGVDVGKKTLSWPVPHVIDDESIGDTESNSSPMAIRIVQLRFVRANDFNSIARDLALRQNRNSKLRLDSEPATNTVVMRGPLAEIDQVEKLAQQLDQPAAGPASSTATESLYGSQPSGTSEFLDFNSNAQWETLQAPADQAKQLREQVALIDQESVQMSNEVRHLQKHYSSQHPKFKSARKNLLTLLEEAFEKRLQLQGIEVALLSSRLREIESRVQQRAKLRQQIIDRRLHELLGEKDDLSWDVVRTAPVPSSRSVDDLLPPQDDFPDDSSADSIGLVQNSPYRDDTLTPPIPETIEAPNVQDGVDPGLPEQPVTVTLPNVEPASDFLPEPRIEADVTVIDDVIPRQPPENPQAQNPLTFPSKNEGAMRQQELIIAENVVEISSLKVERIQSRLAKVKNPEQTEELGYELRLAKLALDQARKLLAQKHRWIEAQRNSLKVNIKLLEKNLEVMETEYLLIVAANKKVPGSVSESEVMRHILETDKAELRLQQAVADLKVFEVENQSSRKPETTTLTNRKPPTTNKPVLPESEPDSGFRKSTRPPDSVFPAEPESIDSAIEPESTPLPIDGLGEPEEPTPVTLKF